MAGAQARISLAISANAFIIRAESAREKLDAAARQQEVRKIFSAKAQAAPAW